MAMEVRVNQVNGRLNLNIKPPNMSLQTKHAADFSMSKQDGTLKVDTKDAKVEISTRQARAALNEKFYKIYSKDLADKGYRDSMQGIAKYAREGDQLARIENKSKPIPSQAKSNFDDDKKELTLQSKPGADINISPGGVQINHTPDNIKINTKSSWPQGQLDWGKIEGYLNPKPEIDIRAVDVKA